MQYNFTSHGLCIVARKKASLAFAVSFARISTLFEPFITIVKAGKLIEICTIVCSQCCKTIAVFNIICYIRFLIFVR